MKRNNGNGWLPREYHFERMAQCSICGERIAWVRLAQRRIPYERDDVLGIRDHRDRCRIWQRLDEAGKSQHRVTPVRRFSRRLVQALVRDGRRPRPRRASKAGSSRDESVAHVPATQAGEQMTRRAGAQATPPLFLSVTA